MILTYPELLQLKRWNTPIIYNGWEAITKEDTSRGWY
jgi:4-hydroxy-4-methyl-2-oxoglutarate aldolase